MSLEIGDDTREIRRGEDSVKVVIEDNPSVNLQVLVRATILERLDKNVAGFGGGEDRQPCYDGCGDEMSRARFVDVITTSHRGKLREAQLRRQARSQVQLGNEEEKYPPFPAQNSRLRLGVRRCSAALGSSGHSRATLIQPIPKLN
jgi:hypothetical protein